MTTSRLNHWLKLAAAPSFAVMAALTGLSGDSVSQLCSSATGVPLTGMFAMYILMSVFHAPPWLALLSAKRSTLNG